MSSDEVTSAASRGGQDEKKKMARSSIACQRCRRSKVKCVNTGLDSVCKSCEISGRECTYQSSGTTTITPKRSEATLGIKSEDGESRKRVKKTDELARRTINRIGEDVLEAPVLTKKIWEDLFEICKLHFSTEISFLRAVSFKNRIRQFFEPREASQSPPQEDDGGKLFLLGVLALTARFHPTLVAHHSSASPPDPLAASEYYTTALINSQGLSGVNLTIATVERTQALLMLALYEWSQSNGARAWIHLGIAIRLAQQMDLSYEDVEGGTPRLLGGDASAESLEKEVRRRTMWSCFIMDRMLGAGKQRTRMIDIESMRVRLPCSEDDFLFLPPNCQTGFLRSTPGPHDNGILNRWVRLVDIWSEISRWSNAGGRRNETAPPWEPECQWYQLCERLRRFQDELPPNYAFSRSNLSAHIERKMATSYISMYTLFRACEIILHREYIPFIALRCKKPAGPLDEPTFSPNDIPTGFFEDSAETLFKAGREIIDIVQACQEDNALPESTLIIFALWLAAFTAVYSMLFPYMDVARYMRRSDHDMAHGATGYAGLAIQVLKKMASRNKMALSYIKKIKKWNEQYASMKDTYQRNRKLPNVGGGLEEYKALERELKDFGILEDSPSGEETSDRSRASTNDITGVSSNGDAMHGVEGLPSLPRLNGSWAAVNTVTPSADSDDRYKSSTPGSSSFQYGYQTTQRSPSTTPNHLSSNNGDNLARLNSPFGRSAADGLPAVSYARSNQAGQLVLPPISQHMAMAPPNAQQVPSHAQWHANDGPMSDNQFQIWLDSTETGHDWHNLQDFPAFA